MNFNRRGRRKKGMVIQPLPLVAFIDVVLFLLLYFVFASDLTPPESQLATTLSTDSKGRAQGASLLPQIIRVEPSPAGPRFRVGDRLIPDRASLESILRQLPLEAGLVIRVDGAVPVEAAAAAISAGKAAGFTKISYVAGR